MKFDMTVVNDVMTLFGLVAGLFFMAVATLGLVRMPDLYHRMHAATKGATLGIVGLLLASMLYLLVHQHEVSTIEVIAKSVLVILFMFIANPVGAHLLSKAAHLDKAPRWLGTTFDELESDA